jgi:hypothetical protein
MSDLTLHANEIAKRSKALRRDVKSLEDLRNVKFQKNGEAFLVERRIYIWVRDDVTPDDGKSSIRSNSIHISSPGRFRRATVIVP